MKSNFSLVYSLLLLVGDFIAIMLSFTIAYILRVSLDDRQLINEIPATTYITAFLIVIPLWLLLFYSIGLYRKDVYEKRFIELGRVLIGTFMGLLLVIGYDFVTNEPLFPARLVAVYALVWSFGLLSLQRQFLWQLRKALFKRGWGISRVMLIGSSRTTKQLAVLLKDTATSGYEISAIVGARLSLPSHYGGKHYTDIDKALKAIPKLGIDTVIQTRMYEDDKKNKKILKSAHSNHVAFKFIPTDNQFYNGKSTIDLFHYFPVISAHQTPLLGWGRIVKRLFDVSVGLIALLVLSPLFLVVAVAIKIEDSKGPAIFQSQRMTRFGQETKIYKFRSMYSQYSGKDPVKVFKKLKRPELIDEYQNNRSKVKNDPRISRVGRFLRSTSLDELPQFYNVLRGDISLIGPRPIPKEELANYPNESPIVLSVKTGITGLAQVSGRSNLTMDERIDLDVFYVQNWSFWFDVRILLKTVWVVLQRNGSV